jgi:hypothetical protein
MAAALAGAAFAQSTPVHRAAVSAPTVQNLPAYRQAAALYAKHDVKDALAQIDALLAAPNLTAADRAFLVRQRGICVGGPLSPPPPLPLSAGKGGAGVARRRVLTPEQADCGPRALLLVCRQMHVAASLAGLRKAAGTTGNGTTLEGLIKAAQSVGLHAEGVQMDRDALANVTGPAIAWDSGDHYVAVLKVDGDTATIHDPNKAAPEDISLAKGPGGLLERSGGILLLLTRERPKPASLPAQTIPQRG